MLITPEAMRDGPGAHVDALKNAGFQVAFPNNPTLARGVGGEDETISELAGCCAVIASSEPYTQRVFKSLPGLRVVSVLLDAEQVCFRAQKDGLIGYGR